MKISKFAMTAIILWLATAAGIAWFFVQGSTSPGTDNRRQINLTPPERDLVLAEMRGLLSATQGIMEGLSAEDMAMVEKSARAAGMAAAADVSPALMAKLPLAFKQLGISVHQGMDAIADAAEGGRPAAEILGQMSGLLTKCVACHAAWQLPSVPAHPLQPDR